MECACSILCRRFARICLQIFLDPLRFDLFCGSTLKIGNKRVYKKAVLLAPIWFGSQDRSSARLRAVSSPQKAEIVRLTFLFPLRPDFFVCAPFRVLPMSAVKTRKSGSVGSIFPPWNHRHADFQTAVSIAMQTPQITPLRRKPPCTARSTNLSRKHVSADFWPARFVWQPYSHTAPLRASLHCSAYAVRRRTSRSDFGLTQLFANKSAPRQTVTGKAEPHGLTTAKKNARKRSFSPKPAVTITVMQVFDCGAIPVRQPTVHDSQPWTDSATQPALSQTTRHRHTVQKLTQNLRNS